MLWIWLSSAEHRSPNSYEKSRQTHAMTEMLRMKFTRRPLTLPLVAPQTYFFPAGAPPFLTSCHLEAREPSHWRCRLAARRRLTGRRVSHGKTSGPRRRRRRPVGECRCVPSSDELACDLPVAVCVAGLVDGSARSHRGADPRRGRAVSPCHGGSASRAGHRSRATRGARAVYAPFWERNEEHGKGMV